MPRGGQARGWKRKRNWGVEYPSFPGESPLQCRRAGLRTVGAEASLSEAWLRCGEGFQETPETLSLTAEKKTTTEKHHELSSGPKTEPTTSKSTSGLTAITWSSSGSDLSDEDKTIFKSQRENGHGSRIGRFIAEIFSLQKMGPVKMISRLLTGRLTVTGKIHVMNLKTVRVWWKYLTVLLVQAVVL
uniref:DUF4502 domain-containing protein n=1 Tax=Balaenoptera musculus TaxID=9771 RepID=A0A8C0E818_BALMU